MLGMTIDVTIWARLLDAPGCRMVVAKQEDDAPRRARCQFKSPRTFRISRVRPSTLSTLSTCPHAAHADDAPRPCMAYALSL